MAKAKIFIPHNRLSPCFHAATGSTTEDLVERANHRLWRLKGAIKAYVLGNIDQIFEIMDQSEDQILAQGRDLGDLALAICEVAAAGDLASIGTVARGIKIMVEDMDRRGSWRVDALRIHVDGLRILTSPHEVSDDAIVNILDDLQFLREKLLKAS